MEFCDSKDGESIGDNVKNMKNNLGLQSCMDTKTEEEEGKYQVLTPLLLS